MILKAFSKFIAVFNLQSPESQTALRTACAVILATFAAFALHLTNPYWSAISACVVSMSHLGASLERGLLRIIGTIIGAALGYVLAGLLINNTLIFFPVVFLIVGLGCYLSLITRFSQSFIIGSITAALVMLSAVHQPDQLFNIAIWRSEEISIGVIAALITSLSIYPQRARIDLNKNQTEFIWQIKQLLILSNQASTRYLNVKAIKKLLNAMKHNLDKSNELLQFSENEFGGPTFSVEISNVISQKENEIYHSLSYHFSGLSRHVNYQLLRDLGAPLQSANEALQNLCAQVASKLEKIHSSPQTSIPTEIKTKIYTLIENLQKLKAADTNQRYSLSASTTAWKLIHLLQHLASQLLAFSNLIENKNDYAVSKKSTTFFTLLRSNLNKENIKFGVKAALGSALATAGWLATNWPGGLQGIISALVLGLQKNIYDTEITVTSALAGCVLGGGIALLALHVFYLNLFNLTLILFPLTWIFAWLTNKNTTLSYAGLQANVALYIALLQPGGPPMTIAPALQRLSGIILGVLGLLIVTRFIWPSHPRPMLKQNLAEIFMRLHNYYQAVFLQQKISKSTLRKLESGLGDLLTNCEKLIESIRKRKGFSDMLARRADKILKWQKEIFLTIFSIANNLEAKHVSEINNIETIHKQILDCLDYYYAILENSKKPKNKFPTEHIIQAIKDHLKVFYESDQYGSTDLKRKMETTEFLIALEHIAVKLNNLGPTTAKLIITH